MSVSTRAIVTEDTHGGSTVGRLTADSTGTIDGRLGSGLDRATRSRGSAVTTSTTERTGGGASVHIIRAIDTGNGSIRTDVGRNLGTLLITADNGSAGSTTECGHSLTLIASSAGTIGTTGETVGTAAGRTALGASHAVTSTSTEIGEVERTAVGLRAL